MTGHLQFQLWTHFIFGKGNGNQKQNTGVWGENSVLHIINYLIFTFIQWGNYVTKKLNNLSKGKELVNSCAGFTPMMKVLQSWECSLPVGQYRDTAQLGQLIWTLGSKSDGPKVSIKETLAMHYQESWATRARLICSMLGSATSLLPPPWEFNWVDKRASLKNLK